MSALDDPFMVLDAAWRFVYVNDSLAALTRTARGDLLGRSIFDVFPDATARSRFADVYAQAMASGESVTFEELFPPLGRWLEVRVHPLDGGLSIQLSDVTDRHHITAEKDQSLRLLEIVSSITEGALEALDTDRLVDEVLRRLLNAMSADLVVLKSEGESRVVVSDNEAAALERPHGGRSAIVMLNHFETAEFRLAGDVQALLQVGWAAPRDESEQDARVVSLVAERMSVVLASARLAQQRNETMRLSRALIEINEMIHSSLELDTLMDRVAQAAAEMLGVDAAVVLTPEDSVSLRAVYQYGLDEGFTGRVFREEQLPTHARVADLGALRVIDDTLEEEDTNRELIEELGIRSELLVPLPGRGDAHGVLGFYRLDEPAPFSDAQVLFAQNLATSISLAIENARLYAAEHGVAENLQSAIIKLPRTVLGMRVAHEYRSASAMAGQVGGDFYDAFAIDGTHLGLLVGDVSGKGLEAAVLTSLVRNAVRAYAMDGDSPALAMAKTNRLMLAHTSGSTFATAVFAILDAETGEFTYTNAGHPAGLLKRASGPVELLEANSPLVGAFDTFTYSQSAVTLSEGDTIVLYTDGVTDARRGSEFYGQERLEAATGELHADPDTLVSGILRSVDEFADRSAPDDIALISVRYRGSR